MLNKLGIKVIIFLAATSLLAIGCGKKGEMKISTEDDAKPTAKPFEAPKISSGGGSTGEVALSDADKELVIPGSKFGKAPPIKQPAKSKKKKKGKKASSSPQHIPYSEGIADQMEGLMWGMSYKKVLSMFEHKLKETFQEDLKAAAGDALAEDKIRTQMLREISKLRKGYIKFEGQRTGYESHLISQEFTHNNGESMMVWDAGKYVEYLFFFDGRFWKRIRSFRVDSFSSELTFDDFLGSIEGHFGCSGKDIFNNKGQLDKVAWRDEETYAYVMDRSPFFGIYALKFTAAITETYLSKLRTKEDRDKGKVSEEISSMVDSVTTMQGDLSDNQSSVIDGYTGEGSGNPSTTKMNTTNSVTNQYKKNKKKDQEKPKADEEKPAPKKEEGNSSDIDDLF